MASEPAVEPITFVRDPESYRHWNLRIEPPLAYLSMAVDPDGGLLGDYELKLNSYDIGVDIELADAVRRLRFEHPEVACVILSSSIAGTFCAGANIRMLAAASHSHKVNFCKFTNETRLEIEEASAASGLRFLAAIGGACSGGGYELALACDHIVLVDDRASAVSLPEVPLLGVLPGTGGLTRLTDKRHVRRDLADVFATRAEGVQGREALDWGLVDELAPPSAFDEAVRTRAVTLAASGRKSTGEMAPPLPVIERGSSGDHITYQYVSAVPDHSRRVVTITVRAASSPDWPLRTALELDDLLCHLRFNEPGLGTMVIETEGDPVEALVHDRQLLDPTNHVEAETALLWTRVLSRLDLTARSIIAVIRPGSCFHGVLAELALAADRSYMLEGIFEDDDEPLPATTIGLTEASTGRFAMANGLSRLESRFFGQPAALERALATIGTPLPAGEALEAGLVTITPDDLDWDDELRLAIEERASYSPDALTAMEANHRFSGPETMATKIFARLSAWQNWVFFRPNASGPGGALQRYGSGSRPEYDYDRT